MARGASSRRPAPTTRAAASAGGGDQSSLPAALRAAVDEAFDVISVERREIELRPPKAESGEPGPLPVIEVDVPRSAWPCVALVEHTRTGRVSWAFADAADDTNRAGRRSPLRFRIPVDDVLGRRRMLATGRIVHVLAAKEDDHLFRASGSQYARWWEQSHRREGLRMFDPASFSIDVPELGLPYPQIKKLSEAPSVLFLHGTMAQSHTGFGAMPRAFMEILSDLYGGRMWAYDHFTLSRSPGDNARLLLDDLRRLARRETFEIDVVAHSRGGLVARELSELASRADQVTVRSITFVATPNAGTPLCRPDNLDAFASQLTNMLLGPEDAPIRDALDSVIALVKHLAVGGLNGIDGVRAMDPEDKRLGALNLGSRPSDVRYFAVGSDHQPTAGSDEDLRLRDPRFDAIMAGAANDLLVPLTSVRATESGTFVEDSDWLPLTGALSVDHADYWRSTRTMNWVRGKLAALRPSPVAPAPVAPAARGGTRGGGLTRNGGPPDGTVPGGEAPVPVSSPVASVATDAAAKVKVSIVHGSLEHADFPVIVGHYDDAPIRGAEGVVDSRLGGILSRRYLIDRYPSLIGESIFLRAPEGQIQYPVGVYVLGLGQTGELNKADLTTAVTRAIVDRCLRLYSTENDRAQAAAKTGQLDVGVSSVLIGSSLEAGGLAVDTSLAALVDGVLRANHLLERYEEDSTTGGGAMPQVRIAALQIVERYADRCELASRALSELDELVGPDRAAMLEVTTTPNVREGALPPRPPAIEVSDTWSRFVVTVSDAEREARERAAASADPAAELGREIELDVSYLGRLARIDRSFHPIDRVAVDRLIEQAMEAGDGTGQSANTLYELLFPRDFKREVAHATELHLIVDELTANYPWELLATRSVGGERRALSLAHGLLRQFREMSPLRWSPRRAREHRALVIGNPPTDSHPSLPGAAEEAQAVTGMLTRYGYKVRSLVWDANKTFVGLGTPPMNPGPAILDALFEDDYRIIHIASHGEVIDDPKRPGEIVQANSGAIIGDDLVLSATTIRQLPAMPDLFFLNCCHLARVGLNRLSAGVARELMAGGVRAVVAAGWPVSDVAAVRFAAALYESLLGGSDYSYAVERARARARDGSNTWAAYQCYGVPGFRLHPGGRTSQPSRPPLTTDELLRRVTWCRVTAGDISRPDGAASSRMRDGLLAELDELAEAAEHEQTWTTPEVCEALGATYADLASPGQGVRWYRKALEGGRTRSAYRFSAVEQLANLEARAAQQLALSLAKQPGGLTPKNRQTIEAQFAEARTRIDRLIEAAGRTDERFALKASLAKKHAACLAPSVARDKLVREAAELYESAEGSAAYQRENAAQLRALLREPARKPRSHLAEGRGSALLIDQQSHLEDYWARTQPGDELLTDLMELWDAPEKERAATSERMTKAYRVAYGARSSYRQRTQTLDHLQDLAYLLQRDDPRWKHLDKAVADLSALTGTVSAPASVTEGPVDAAPVVSAPPQGPRGRREPAVEVTVQALPASYGDALLVTYGDEKNPSRMLIDAGPANAFKSSVRSALGDHLDLMVITHVDADHIDGAIQLLVDGTVKADDIWFNGWKHLPPARGGAEGAILDMLLDGLPWNVAFEGGTIQVPETGPLPSVLVAGGARVTILSPVAEGLTRLRQTWQRQLKEKGAIPGDPVEALRLLAEADRFDEARGERPMGRDGSVPNGSSIAFLFEIGALSCLFTGDAHAGVMAQSLRRLAAERGVPKVRLDLFKVSHHGSRGNISEDVLKTVDCTQFLVSTDGKRFNHPDEDAIRTIADAVPGAKILVNYQAIAERPGISDLVILQAVVELKG